MGDDGLWEHLVDPLGLIGERELRGWFVWRVLKLRIERKEEGGPVDAVEADDLFADEVEVGGARTR